MAISPSAAHSIAINAVFIPLLIGLIAFGFNVAEAWSRGSNAATYMSKVNAKVVGIAPGTSASRKICYLHAAAGASGGIAIALMAMVSNAFDAMFATRYGVSPGCTGVLLMTNLFVAVIRKVSRPLFLD